MSRAHRGGVKHATLLFAAAFITLPAFAATDVVTNLSDSGVSGDGSLRGENTGSSRRRYDCLRCPGLRAPSRC